MRLTFKQSILLLLTTLLTACNTPFTRSNRNPQQDFNNSPYAKFKQERASVEPLTETSPIVTPTQINISNKKSNVSLPQVQPLNITGNLKIGGSTGVLPLNKLIYDRFIALGYSGVINFSNIGADESIQLFCQQEKFDLLTLARPMNKSEIAACQAKGIEPISFNIGKDAVAIIVSRQNDFLDRVTLPMLAEIFTQEKWSDVDPNFPDKPIERFPTGPNASFDLVVDKVLEGNGTPLLNAPNTTLYWYEQPMIQRLSNNIYGISFVSSPVLKEATNSVKSIVVEGTTPQSIKLTNKKYPLELSLYIYVDREQLKKQPELNSFVNFYLTHVNEQIEDAGLFPLSPQELDKSKTQFLQIMQSS
ncbi:MAG: substrate-binding domain-containing protein [Cyanobacteria bacterium P01_G01_bin.39]